MGVEVMSHGQYQQYSNVNGGLPEDPNDYFAHRFRPFFRIIGLLALAQVPCLLGIVGVMFTWRLRRPLVAWPCFPMNTFPPLLAADEGHACTLLNADGAGHFFLACDHASSRIPRALGTLGLSDDALSQHIAW
ncbi:MAG: hypothetical protein RL026_2184, partial [Pseudomonadota bacterium]